MVKRCVVDFGCMTATQYGAFRCVAGTRGIVIVSSRQSARDPNYLCEARSDGPLPPLDAEWCRGVRDAVLALV